MDGGKCWWQCFHTGNSRSASRGCFTGDVRLELDVEGCIGVFQVLEREREREREREKMPSGQRRAHMQGLRGMEVDTRECKGAVCGGTCSGEWQEPLLQCGGPA